ncbi:MAG: hypothetical protein ACM3O8_13795 [Methylococcaceae bacterium]|nr:hypothetical protein [Prolixibacteraceae bacterium]
MKNKLKLLVIGSISAIMLIPGFAFSQAQDVKKTRHIKMMKIENGKKMEIDTVLTGNDVFVWNGDTINPEKHIEKFSPSEFDKRHPEKVHKMIMHADSGEDVRIITEEGDTVGEKIIIHKRMRDGNDNDHFIYLNRPGGYHFPPVPGAPAVPHIKRFKGMNNSKMINLNDPNVISFKKKDMSGGREKIEIIRKKTSDSDNMNVDIDIDDALQVPEPPMPPMMEGTMDQDSDRRMMKQESDENSKAAVKKAERKAARENK